MERELEVRCKRTCERCAVKLKLKREYDLKHNLSIPVYSPLAAKAKMRWNRETRQSLLPLKIKRKLSCCMFEFELHVHNIWYVALL